MRMSHATLPLMPEQSRPSKPSPRAPSGAHFLGTVVLLLAIGTVVALSGLMTFLVLHPLSDTTLAERAMAIVAIW